MLKGETVAAAYIAAGFAFISVIALVVEPQLGLVEPSDQLDPVKISGVIRLPVMIAGNVTILGFSFAVAYLAARSEDIYFAAAGFVAAFAFLVLGCLGQAAAAVPVLIPDVPQQEIAQLALAAVRSAFLRAAVLSLAVVAWRSTLAKPIGDTPFLWRLLGVLILLGGLAFFFVFVPVPLMFTVWAAWYAARLARAA